MPAVFDYIQTFYVNPDAVNSASEIMITSLDLFFKGKPSLVKNVSGSANPGISVWLCEVTNTTPNPSSVVRNSVTNIPYERINTSGNALTATTVAFTRPIVVASGKYYGIVVKYEDPAFDIWINKQGDSLVTETGSTNTPSPGAQNRFDGYLYKASNSLDFISFSDRDLKFKVNIAKFEADSGSFNLVNKPYEFINIGTSSGAFLGGEWVYQNNADQTGTLSVSSTSATITGTGTTFTNNHLGLYAVVSNGSAIDILKVVDVANSTSMTVEKFPRFSGSGFTYKIPPIGKVYFTDYTKDRLILVDSNAANAAFRFGQGNTVIGERSGATATIASIDVLSLDEFTPKFFIGNPSTANFTIDFKCANTSNVVVSALNSIQLLKSNRLSKKFRILSRSQEVVESGMFGDNNKSAVANVTMTITANNNNLFSVPYIKNDQLDFHTYQNEINYSRNSIVNGIIDYDTEVDRNGLATSKYISKKISFDANKYAEDVVVYLTAHRPAGTVIDVYTKIHNSADRDAFDDKAWSPLELKNNVDRYSSLEDENDLIEYTYGLPQYPEVYSRLTGNFTTTNGSEVIATSTDQTGNVNVGDLLKVAAPLFPENHEVFTVLAVDATTITVDSPIVNVGIIGDVIIDKLKYSNVAWNNIANDNVARYVNSSLVKFDYYNTMQIKIVLRSIDTNIIPQVDQYEAIGVSA